MRGLRWWGLAALLVLSLPVAAKTNILVIIADDLGYADMGVVGSNIRTPNIDALAAEGLMLTRFTTAPMCAPTRAMLFSGNNNHVAGMGSQFAGGAVRDHLPGYEKYLSDRVAHLPQLMSDAGYHTGIAGKWHLGRFVENGPHSVGFERSFSLMYGAANHWDEVGMYDGGTLYVADGAETTYPEGRYSTTVYTEKLIEYMSEAIADDRPFFTVAAYTTPHWPLQVPDDELDLYAGEYDRGYDWLRKENFRRLKKAGVLDASHKLPPRNPAITPWRQLDKEARRRESRKMELYAAMVDNLDRHVGTLISFLREKEAFENTLIIFMGDNGAAAEDFYYGSRFKEYIRKHYSNDYENMGKPSSWVSYGPQWAEAGSAPFSRHKTYTREGGMIAPFIVTGPGVSAKGERSDAFVTLMDLAPTFLELGGGTYPGEGVAPMLGESMVPFLAGETDRVHDDDYVFTLIHDGRAMLRQGDWKISTLEKPFDESKFELHNLIDDPGEARDLSAVYPEKREQLIELWRTERRRLNITLPQDL